MNMSTALVALAKISPAIDLLIASSYCRLVLHHIHSRHLTILVIKVDYGPKRTHSRSFVISDLVEWE